MRWHLGVDLGTSFCCAAVATDAGVEVLEVGGERRIPSTVLLADDGLLLAGTFAQRGIGRSPDRVERNPKRYVGRGPMLLGGRQVTAAAALGALLTSFVTEARRRFDGTAPDLLVLTHPVTWDDERTSVLRSAAAEVLPGVECHLLSEPEAAAWHYAATVDSGLSDGDAVAVYDLGGGTFDAAVLRAVEGGFAVASTPDGDPEIGGEAFDSMIYARFGEQLGVSAPDWWEQVSTNPERRWLSSAGALLREARLAKEWLSDYPTAAQYVPGADVDVQVSRDELEQMIGDDVRRTVTILGDVVRGAGLEAGRLRGIYLTGGASRIPLVRSALDEQYPGLVHTLSDPKTVVAAGAAGWGRRHAGSAAEPETLRTTAASDGPTVVGGATAVAGAGDRTQQIATEPPAVTDGRTEAGDAAAAAAVGRGRWQVVVAAGVLVAALAVVVVVVANSGSTPRTSSSSSGITTTTTMPAVTSPNYYYSGSTPSTTTTTTTPPVTTTSSYGLPSSFAGSRSGNQSQPGYGVYPVQMNLTSGDIGDAVGSMTFPQTGCSFRLYLDDVTSDTVYLQTSLVGGNCVDGVLAVQLNGSSLSYTTYNGQTPIAYGTVS